MRGTDRSSRLVALAATLTLLCVPVGCSNDDSEVDTPVGKRDSNGVSVTQMRKQAQKILNQRARAVREGDLDLFLRRVDQSDEALMARQRRYFRNLAQLPLAKFRYRVLDQQWQVRTPKRWGRQVHVPRVRQIIQLQEYDAVPVERVVGLVFSFRKGRARIVSDQTATGKMLFEGTPAPWDQTAVTVREEPGVLAVFDRETSASAETLTAAVRDGIAEIDRALPFTWPGRVVVYSMQDPRVLSSFTDVPGGTLEHLGALTFPTYAETGRPQVASTRMLVMSSSVEAGQPFLGRITRHELSHIAVGVRDDGAPVWVSEGLAEYLGAREIPLRDRIIPTSALSRAKSEVTALPISEDFNSTDQEWHYALSWMACDYIVAAHDESRLWELVDAMHNGGEGTTDGEQDRVLEQVLGYDGAELASRAAERIRKLYG